MVRLRTALLGGQSCVGGGDEDEGVGVPDSLVAGLMVFMFLKLGSGCMFDGFHVFEAWFSKPLFLATGGGVYGNMLVTWLDPQPAVAIARATTTTTTTTNGMVVNTLVPYSNLKKELRLHARDPTPIRGIGSCMVGGPTPMGSCSIVGATTQEEGGIFTGGKRGRVEHVAGSGMDQSMSNNAKFGRQSQQVTLDIYEREFGVIDGFTSTLIASMDKTSSDKQCTRTTTIDDHDSVCHSRTTVRFSLT
ncbi:hypothetical protein RYX36_029388 [Vicia faba]